MAQIGHTSDNIIHWMIYVILRGAKLDQNEFQLEKDKILEILILLATGEKLNMIIFISEMTLFQSEISAKSLIKFLKRMLNSDDINIEIFLGKRD